MLSFQTRTLPGATVLAVAGAVQAPDNAAFAAELDRLRPSRPAFLVLDLAGTEYLNSRAIGEIVGLYQHLRENGGELAVAGARPAVGKVLRVCGLGDLMGVHESVEAALSARKGARA